MAELSFSWDENKNQRNQQKHGVSFEEAQTVFNDEQGRLIADPDHSEEEDRFLLMGFSAITRVLIVSHCYRDGEMIRIISARQATRQEQQQYRGYYDA